MESIEERAKSYVEGCELQGKEARRAEFDYIAGAKEERILLTEWRKMSEAKDLEFSKQYLLRIKRPNWAIGCGEYHYEVCHWMSGDFCIHSNYMSNHKAEVEWREIRECCVEPTKKYYGDDDGKAE